MHTTTPLLDRIARREQNDERQHERAQRPAEPFVAPWRRKELERFERVGYVAVADLTPTS